MTRRVKVVSPINIALIKYWGKHDQQTVLPTTTSLSLTLTDLTTTTLIEEGDDLFLLNGKPLTEKEMFHLEKILHFFPKEPRKISSINHFPTAAGLASSASGMAALTVALDAFYGTNYEFQKLVEITRLGSGSSCRSLVDGFGIWHKDGTVESLNNPFTDLAMIVVVVSDQKKHISSREAMALTQATAPSYQSWIEHSQHDFDAMIGAIRGFQFHRLGEVMEINSDRLHQVMKDARPSIVYQTEQSKHIIDTVKNMRSSLLPAYTTMDAGPNVKILIRAADSDTWTTTLKSKFNFPIIVSRIGGKAHVEA
jgi:diphosphomevalonate decarboxylase